MTNEQKYKTAEERNEAYYKYCVSQLCQECKLHSKRGKELTCAFNWLALEAEEEKPMPCPFCRSEATVGEHSPYFDVECKCGYVSALCDTKENAISAHNRVCRAVEAPKKGEVK